VQLHQTFSSRQSSDVNETKNQEKGPLTARVLVALVSENDTFKTLIVPTV